MTLIETDIYFFGSAYQANPCPVQIALRTYIEIRCNIENAGLIGIAN